MSKSQKLRKTRKPRNIAPQFIILTEGEKTEVNYIKGYLKHKGHRDIDIIVNKGDKNSPHEMLEEMKKRKKSDKDQCWLVFDRDGHVKIPETFNEARAANIHIAFSSICFETWILLHYKYTSAPYISFDALSSAELKDLIPNYEKSLHNIFDIANQGGSGLEKAIRHAKQLINDQLTGNPNAPIHTLNPYTDVHVLLEHIDAFFANKQNLNA